MLNKSRLCWVGQTHWDHCSLWGGICIRTMGGWVSPHCSAPPSILLVKELLSSWFYIKNHGGNVSSLPFKCHIPTVYNMPSIVQMVRRYIDIWGDSLPASFPWEPNSEALASLTNAQWNPCSYAYFGCISMFVIFSLETVSHTHVASVWSVIISPATFPCPLCLEGGMRTWFSLGKWYKMWLLKWSFKRVLFYVCSYYAGCIPGLPSPETME